MTNSPAQQFQGGAPVITGALGIDAGRIAMLPALEIIAVNGIGVDAVDLDCARARGIVVSNTPGVLTDDVADLAVTLLLAAARRLPALDRYVRAGAWERGGAPAPSRSVRGKVAGIFGFGRIGRAVAHRLAAFGMELRYYQPSVAADTTVARSASLLALAADSDYLLVCAPGGALVNIARGSLVDQEALIAALRDGGLGAAALDVFADEPRVPASLSALDNTVLTPHVGSLTVETRQAMGQLVIDNLSAHFAGKPLPTPVR